MHGENYRAVGAFPQRLRDVAPHPAPELSPSRRRILTATLTAGTGRRTHKVTLSWTAFSTQRSVSGTVDGIPFA
ncbi:hypothetical protein [Nonomuraea sp. NPDC005692]|uniref:hypothetical protein n=1 Tax=Nonomuraea sp. NPDC005692 TaxID=3157168 RepID=UPI0033CC688E